MRCLFCGKRLALLRKLTDGEFCSTAHRKRYLEEEQKLALARLIEEQRRNSSGRSSPEPPPAAPSENRIQEPAGFRSWDLRLKGQRFSPRAGAQQFEEVLQAQMLERRGLGPAFSRSLRSEENGVLECRNSALIPCLASGTAEILERPLASALGCGVGDLPAPVATQPRIADLVSPVSTSAKDVARRAARRSKTSIFLKLLPPAKPSSTGLVPAAETLESVDPVRGAASEVVAAGEIEAISGRLAPEMACRLPDAVRLMARAHVEISSGPPMCGAAGEPALPATRLNRAALGIPGLGLDAGLAGARPANARQASADPGFQAFEVAVSHPGGAPASPARIRSETCAARVEPSLAVLAAATLGTTAEIVLPPELPALLAGGSLPPDAAIRPCVMPVRTAQAPVSVSGNPLQPDSSRLAPLSSDWCEVQLSLSPPVRDAAPPASGKLRALSLAMEPRQCANQCSKPAGSLPVSPKFLLPKLRIETVMPNRLKRAARGAVEIETPSRRSGIWMAAPRFWKMAPADLKWISLTLPAILLVTVISAVGWLPAKRAQARRQPEPSRSSYLENVVLERWASVRRNIGNRAAIILQDDFRSGLADWEGPGNWAKEWQYDPAGFLLTGPMALYRPSRGLANYNFEFLGQIDKKSLNWVFRAADYKNYYAMKIVLLKTAPLPTAAVVRYAVIDGKQDKPVQLPLPMAIRSDMFFRIRVEVRDQNFTTTVQGQVADFWSDDRIGRGGVGFFSEKGERARLRWMEISHQYDALGRLCALLAPYSIQSGNGSLNRQ